MSDKIDPRAQERQLYDDTDFGDIDLEPAIGVTLDRQVQPRSTFAIRLDGETIAALRDIASRYKTRPTQLARDWIVERLAEERGKETRQVVVEFRPVRPSAITTALSDEKRVLGQPRPRKVAQ